jgi:hypothetical protein
MLLLILAADVAELFAVMTVVVINIVIAVAVLATIEAYGSGC